MKTETFTLWVGFILGFWVMGMATFIIPFHLAGVESELVKNNLAYYNENREFTLNKLPPLLCQELLISKSGDIEYHDVKVNMYSLDLTDNKDYSKYIFDFTTHKYFDINTCIFDK
jgi:hypothetical protein